MKRNLCLSETWSQHSCTFWIFHEECSSWSLQFHRTHKNSNLEELTLQWTELRASGFKAVDVPHFGPRKKIKKKMIYMKFLKKKQWKLSPLSNINSQRHYNSVEWIHTGRLTFCPCLFSLTATLIVKIFKYDVIVVGAMVHIHVYLTHSFLWKKKLWVCVYVCIHWIKWIKGLTETAQTNHAQANCLLWGWAQGF